MPYQRLSIDAGAPVSVRRLITRLEDHYFADVHCMLRLPIPSYRLVAGCNFAIAQILLSAVSGLSVTLYAQNVKPRESGKQFRGLLTDYFRWDLEPNPPSDSQEAAKTLYTVFRNPLTHDLGLDLAGNAATPKVKVKRLTTNQGSRGLLEKTIEQLEDTSCRLSMSSTLTVRSDATVLLVEGLYWGIRKMIEKLTSDHPRMAKANAYLSAL